MTIDSPNPANGRPAGSPLPGMPLPYVMRRGEGEHALLFDNTFTVMLSSDETEGQYSASVFYGAKGQRIPAHLHQVTNEFFYVIKGALTLWTDDRAENHQKVLLEPGDLGFVPRNIVHAYRVEMDSEVFGVGTGDFMRFFRAAGTQASGPGIPTTAYVPTHQQLEAAGDEYDVHFMPDFQFRD